MQTPSILVIGAGPAGLTAAIECARRGFRVRIVDQQAEGAKESRAVAVNVKSLRVLEPSGVTAKLVARGVHMQAVRMIIDGKLAARVNLRYLPKPYDYMLALPQSDTEAILAESLAALGITVDRKVECTGFSQNADTVTATLRHGVDGREEMVACNWLVAADGAHSTVRHVLGLQFAGAAYPFQWSLADVDLTGDVQADEGEARITPGGPAILRFPIAPGRHRLIATIPDVLDHLPAGWIAGTVHWRSSFSVSHRMVEQRLVGRVALIGDAAHIHSPAGGRGMNLGIEDAASFAAALDAGTMSSWEAKRLARARTILRESDQMQRVVTLKSGFFSHLLLFAVSKVISIPFIQKVMVTRIAAANE